MVNIGRLNCAVQSSLHSNEKEGLRKRVAGLRLSKRAPWFCGEKEGAVHDVSLAGLLAPSILYDRINTRSYSPIKCPPSDALERAKEVLAEIENWPDDTDPDVQELRDILCDPHLRVSHVTSIKHALSDCRHIHEAYVNLLL
ncbi:hypothetical protein AVEN_181037-1 [Araneus ventricosus]|uniref:Uncharacterized protein n=1 Tax=Araneus ventricosus TaxID=182803 RepID=A0A4Y2L123_ARAVE|nr:hypothetical protein AVEN_181037-1 [Araneus ventricosus]